MHEIKIIIVTFFLLYKVNCSSVKMKKERKKHCKDKNKKQPSDSCSPGCSGMDCMGLQQIPSSPPPSYEHSLQEVNNVDVCIRLIPNIKHKKIHFFPFIITFVDKKTWYKILIYLLFFTYCYT